MQGRRLPPPLGLHFPPLFLLQLIRGDRDDTLKYLLLVQIGNERKVVRLAKVHLQALAKGPSIGES